MSFIFVVLLSSCSKDEFKWKTKSKNTLEFIQETDSILKLQGVSAKDSYGYDQTNPIKLGVKNRSLAIHYPEKYFKSITGANGEKVIAFRVKSCCPFKTVNSEPYPYRNVAVLDVYIVTLQGSEQPPKQLFINFFDQGKLFAPKGFLVKKIIN